MDTSPFLEDIHDAAMHDGVVLFSSAAELKVQSSLHLMNVLFYFSVSSLHPGFCTTPIHNHILNELC